MYSGTELHNKSGAVIGGHQKIDRVARNNLTKLGVNTKQFPSSKQILYFEGRNGPDGIKVKSPAQNEPWHYIDPFDSSDTALIKIISEHYANLVQSLARKDNVSAAFQAAWLAHGVVDGLTPAHHFPYEAQLEEMMEHGIDQRTSIKKKLILPGKTKREIIKNNWRMWGIGGLMSMHGLFELGVAMIIAPLRFPDSLPQADDFALIAELGVEEYFLRHARQIAVLDSYERFHKSGWTNKLIRDVKNELAPAIIRCLTTIWYQALIDAEVKSPKD